MGNVYHPPSKMTAPLSVIVPVYNEASFIVNILQRVQANPVVKEIIVIDDFSTDGTRDVLTRLKDDPSFSASNKIDTSAIKFFFHAVNQGKGAALRTGIKHATAPITIIQDADLEYDPREYERIIAPILKDEADAVFGSRFLLGEKRRPHFFWHTFGNKILTLVSNRLTHLNLSDMETCYKAIKTKILQSIPLRSNRFGFEPEVTAKLAKLKIRICEVPISYRGRSYSEGKKINWKDGVSAFYTMFKFWLIEDLSQEKSGS